MSIERYADFMLRLHVVLVYFFIVAGVVEFFIRLRKKNLKFWWVTPCLISYSMWGTFITGSSAFIKAYDDISNPDYWKYEDWGLGDFVFLNIKTVIIWLLIGALFYFLFETKFKNEKIKAVCASLLMGFIFLFIGLIFGPMLFASIIYLLTGKY